MEKVEWDCCIRKETRFADGRRFVEGSKEGIRSDMHSDMSRGKSYIKLWTTKSDSKSGPVARLGKEKTGIVT